MKEMKVDPIKNGTVIDHIPAGKALEVLDILNLKGDESVLIGINLTSKKLGKKDIIKVENIELSQREVNRIAIIAPTATLVIIRDYEIVSKAKVSLPSMLEGVVGCPNPKCITNHESIVTKFIVTSKEDKKARCWYCERIFNIDELRLV